MRGGRGRGDRKKAVRSCSMILDRLAELLLRHSPDRLERFWGHVDDQAGGETSTKTSTEGEHDPGRRPGSDT